MKNNGSPAPIFDTDDNRSYFFVELPVHPDFAGERILVKEQEGVEDGVEDGVGVEGQLSPIQLEILLYTKQPRTRADILNQIGMINHSNNYKRHIAPLISQGRLRMTHPDKPNSKNQRYIAVR